jgi:hypothetical protein
MPCFNKLEAVIQIRRDYVAELEHQRALYEKPLEAGRPDRVRPSSIVELIACRQQLNGRMVRVEGCMVLQIEHVAIYLSEQDAKYNIWKNAIGLSASGRVWGERDKYHMKYVLVEGTFDACLSLGDALRYSGVIRDVVHITPLVLLPES